MLIVLIIVRAPLSLPAIHKDTGAICSRLGLCLCLPVFVGAWLGTCVDGICHNLKQPVKSEVWSSAGSALLTGSVRQLSAYSIRYRVVCS